MDLSFTSQDELFKRVKPALQIKYDDIVNCGFKDVKLEEIWNYLIKTNWIKRENLSLFDIVNDILNLDNERFINYKLEEVEHEDKE